MKYDPDKHHRRSIRLKEYDYSQVGAYFITICTYNGECVLGDVVDRSVSLSAVGKIAKVFFEEIPNHFEGVALDEFVVMPNHLHGIIIIQDVGVQNFEPYKSEVHFSIRCLNH
jgi:REP element-mobilizing transposase RayT